MSSPENSAAAHHGRRCEVIDYVEQIERLDVGLFTNVSSQTSVEDRRSLLAVQRAVAKAHPQYTYLEIGSHLGGTIQTHLADSRCVKIYSIDPRPAQQPDDRSLGYIAHYENNSSERMLRLLNETGLGNVGKIECIESDASQVETTRITPAPQIAFIDGEHTKQAVASDFRFCTRIIATDGVILFHDFDIVYDAIIEICREIQERPGDRLPVKLGDGLFAIFYGRTLLDSDQVLNEYFKRSARFMLLYRMKSALKRFLPKPLIRAVSKILDCPRRSC